MDAPREPHSVSLKGNVLRYRYMLLLLMYTVLRFVKRRLPKSLFGG